MAFQLDIKDNATTQDTVNAIIEVINKTSKEGFAPQLAQALNPGAGTSKLDYIKRLFDFICKNVDYKADPIGWEKIYTPAKLFQDAEGDCKKMTTAIGAVLKAAGIEPLLKVITYDGKSWAHIYVICKINQKYYVLDPVNKKTFDSEINHKRAAVYNLAGNFEIMPGTKLSILGGADTRTAYTGLDELAGDLDEASNQVGNMVGMHNSMGATDVSDLLSHFESHLSRGSLSGMGKIKLLEKLKNAIQKVIHVGVVVGAAPMRAAALGIIILGKALEHTPIKMHLAKKLAMSWQKDNGAKLSELWKKFGGDPNTLKQAIAKGSGTQLSGIESNGDLRIEGIGVVTIAAITAAIAAATPILVGLSKVMKDHGVSTDSEEKSLADTTQAGIEAHNDDGSLPDSIKNKLAETAAGTKSGGVVDLSENTIIKAIFLICISPVLTGVSFFLLNLVCISTIIYILFTKLSKYEIQF